MNNQVDSLGYYAVIGVLPNDDISYIKRKYYELAKALHPDHNASQDAVDTFQKLSVAYDVINNPMLRAQYDMLSVVYGHQDFPQLGSLKIYKNQSDKDDAALRVLKQRTVNADFKETVVRESKDICNIREAANMVMNTSIHNWTKGWWGKGAFSKNLRAIKFNLASITVSDEDNLKLLLHNAAAYAQENNSEMAWIYAQQAKAMWNDNELVQQVTDNFIKQLDFTPSHQVVIPYWNAAELRRRQMLFPLLLLFIVLLFIFAQLYRAGIIGVAQEESYYYTNSLAADTIISKVIKTDSDPYSTEYLVHFNKDTAVYHGPDSRYAEITKIEKDHTVRITGYMPNRKWYQVVLDDGERGFVRKEDIEKGMGKEVPLRSQVYKN